MKFVFKASDEGWEKNTGTTKKNLQIARKVYLILYETEKLAS